jgi:hypothetical protein
MNIDRIEKKADRAAARNKRIRQHGLNLLAIFPEAREQDPVKLCKLLRRHEIRADQISVGLCNRTASNPDDSHKALEIILGKVENLLCGLMHNAPPIFINMDPRGYALKIMDSWMQANPECKLQRDMGGYGIIAPEIE